MEVDIKKLLCDGLGYKGIDEIVTNPAVLDKVKKFPGIIFPLIGERYMLTHPKHSEMRMPYPIIPEIQDATDYSVPEWFSKQGFSDKIEGFDYVIQIDALFRNRTRQDVQLTLNQLSEEYLGTTSTYQSSGKTFSYHVLQDNAFLGFVGNTSTRSARCVVLSFNADESLVEEIRSITTQYRSIMDAKKVA